MKTDAGKMLLSLMLLIAASTAWATPLAELVAFRTEDRVLLHGLHYRPDTSSNAMIIHIPGGPGAFYSMQDMGPIAEAVNEEGYHFLSINTRTAGANGLMYGIFEDYRWDVAAAVAYARKQEMDDIVLLGQSLGSARALYYLAETEDDPVDAVILSGAITSPYQESQYRWNKEEQARYDAFLAEQRENIEAGRGRELASYPWFGPRRPPLQLSARSWVSIFGTPGESKASTVQHAEAVTVPVLIIHGTEDKAARPENAKAIKAALTNSPETELVWIEGGDHLFLGNEKQVADAITDWLEKTVPVGKDAAGQ